MKKTRTGPAMPSMGDGKVVRNAKGIKRKSGGESKGELGNETCPSNFLLPGGAPRWDLRKIEPGKKTEQSTTETEKKNAATRPDGSEFPEGTTFPGLTTAVSF